MRAALERVRGWNRGFFNGEPAQNLAAIVDEGLSSDAGAALLKRIEAAEAVCKLADVDHESRTADFVRLNHALEAWRKLKV